MNVAVSKMTNLSGHDKEVIIIRNAAVRWLIFLSTTMKSSLSFMNVAVSKSKMTNLSGHDNEVIIQAASFTPGYLGLASPIKSLDQNKRHHLQCYLHAVS